MMAQPAANAIRRGVPIRCNTTTAPDAADNGETKGDIKVNRSLLNMLLHEKPQIASKGMSRSMSK
jgi:hypothetical protein